MRLREAVVALMLMAALAACSEGAVPAPPADSVARATSSAPSPPTSEVASSSSPVDGTSPPTAPPVEVRPAWLGTRPLPLRADGFGEVQPTPPELVDRRFPTVDVLPPPDGGTFVSTVQQVPSDVLERSTWGPDCPVRADELVYLTVSFWGFDGQEHTGELLVNVSVGDDVVEVFAALYAGRFPIEEMRIVALAELALPPTGDGNNTTAFVCRQVTKGTRWSEHAFGLALDINPFQNPYQKADLVVPELAGSYTDRTNLRPGMITSGDLVTGAFAEIGWGWGGDWTSLVDTMHFSHNGH